MPVLDPGATRATGPLPKGAVAGRVKRVMAISCRVCGTGLVNGADRKMGRCSSCPSDLDEELLARLLDWRARLAGIQKVPAFVVFTDVTLAAIAERRPGRREELAVIAGIGPRKLGLYGDDVLALVGGSTVDELAGTVDAQ